MLRHYTWLLAVAGLGSTAAAAAAVAAAAAASSCAVVLNGTVLGSVCHRGTCTLHNQRCASASQCCDLCVGYDGCTVWTFESAHGGACFLKNSTAGSDQRSGAVSGCVSAADCPPPPPPPQPHVTVRVDQTAIRSRTDPGFKCWNIDASPNREWETRDLSNPLLASLGRQSLPGYLRFGGSGNDGLPYALDMSDPSSAGNRCLEGSKRCLNRTWTDNLANFARRSGAKLVFGLNMMVCSGSSSREGGACRGSQWNPTEAKALMRYLIQANHSVFGFELGKLPYSVFFLPHGSDLTFLFSREQVTSKTQTSRHSRRRPTSRSCPTFLRSCGRPPRRGPR
jgi:hypothetical protein